MKNHNPSATPAQDKANDIFLSLGLDAEFEKVRLILELAGFCPTDDEIEMGYEDACWDVDRAAELAEIDRRLEELQHQDPPFYPEREL